MARPLRIEYPNAYYHVTCRGNARENIVTDAADRFRFLDILARSAEIYQVKILAFVIMTNHFHLVVVTPNANLHDFMRHFNISFTSFFNRKYDRVGHLFQGRYKAFLIDADSYLLEVSRYIHLNPVKTEERRQHSVKENVLHLRKFPWSSYPVYSGKKKAPPFLSTEEILGFFGKAQDARNRYGRFVEEGIGTILPNPFAIAKGHGIIGDKVFVAKLKELLGSTPKSKREQPATRHILRLDPDAILASIGKYFAIDRELILQRGQRSIARAFAMELLYRYGKMNQREIGELMSIDYSAVSLARKRLQVDLDKNRSLRGVLNGLIEDICKE
jgi:REP element-mobilizing transposase RayT